MERKEEWLGDMSRENFKPVIWAPFVESEGFCLNCWAMEMQRLQRSCLFSFILDQISRWSLQAGDLAFHPSLVLVPDSSLHSSTQWPHLLPEQTPRVRERLWSLCCHLVVVPIAGTLGRCKLLYSSNRKRRKTPTFSFNSLLGTLRRPELSLLKEEIWN